jgi:hypothetical protein
LSNFVVGNGIFNMNNLSLFILSLLTLIFPWEMQAKCCKTPKQGPPGPPGSGSFTQVNGSFTVTITERASGVVTGQYSVFAIAPDGTVQPGFTTTVPLVATNQAFTIGPPIFLGPYYIVIHDVSLSAPLAPATNVHIQDTFGHVDRFNSFYSIGPGSGVTLPDYTDQQFYFVPYVSAP